MPVLRVISAMLALASSPEPRDLPPALKAPFEQGVAALKAGRLEEAEAAFKNVLRGGGDLAYVHNNLALAYQGRGEQPLAIRSFREAIRRDARYVAPRVGLGASLSALGRLAEATRELERAMRLAPREPLVRRQLAQVHERARNWSGAVEQYRALRELAPRDPEYAYLLGKAYLSLSEWCLLELRDLEGGGARLQQARGHNYRVQGRNDLALLAFEQAVKEDATLAEVHLAIAQIHMTEGRWAEAREAIARELSLVPESAGARALQQRLQATAPASP